MPVANATLSAVSNENFAPADTIGHPAPEEGARHRAEARGDQDQRRLAIGKLPVLENERQHIADQKEIEKSSMSPTFAVAMIFH